MSKITWDDRAYSALVAENYEEVVRIYEQLVEAEPKTYFHYWHLGLAYLLQHQEESAQNTWLFVFMQGTLEEADQWTNELSEILEAEAQSQEQRQNLTLAWLVRSHLRELAPHLLENLLALIRLDITLGQFIPEKLSQWQVAEILQKQSTETTDRQALCLILKQLAQFPAPEALTVMLAALPHLSQLPDFADQITIIATVFAHEHHQFGWGITLLETSLTYQPQALPLLHNLCNHYRNTGKFSEAMATAKRAWELSETLPTQALSHCHILRIAMSRSDWQAATHLAERHKDYLRQLSAAPAIAQDPSIRASLLKFVFVLPYLQDNLLENRSLTNQITDHFQQAHQFLSPSSGSSPSVAKRLRIGYISHTLKRHSVGWLSRWLFKYHDRNQFDLSLYLVSQRNDEITTTWFQSNCDRSYNFSRDPRVIYEQIRRDEIDILVDLDSLTNNLVAVVMSWKPAPVQITWLGFDASGIPAIDYFLADPYVLPGNAQDYYRETLWRLPATYIAVDGFEIGVPTLSRSQLGIPNTAVVYFNQQNGLKHNPYTIHLQMKILNAVDSSYLLIKGLGEEQAIQQLFTEIAEQEGVAPDRLRFLRKDPDEATHRANLQIADVVLDTYPYNGATTTLEVLWLGIPLVTRVGEQFAARNSYAFMTNAGLTEGIAWTDEEYIEWGVRLGLDRTLREQVILKLKASRLTSPLWQAQEFTREMEKAYQQIWAQYLEQRSTQLDHLD